jgi:ABC-2 type transport system permease protein
MPIFDQGYQHWDGKLAGHGWRWLAITRAGVRNGLKGRWVRYLLFVSWVPALALTAFLCAWGLIEQKSPMVATAIQILRTFMPQMVLDPLHYRPVVWRLAYSIFLAAELRFSLIIILLVGPQLISQDLRFNALPLYFSRPLRRMDYFLGKLGVIAVFLGMVVIVPTLIAYFLGMLFSLDLTMIRDTYPILLASLAYGVIITLSAGLFVLALSALSRNSRYVTLMFLGVLLVGAIVSSTLQSVEQGQRQHAYFQRMGIASMRSSRMSREDRMRAYSQMNEVTAEEAMAAGATDWRPLVSYVADLSRVGLALLQTPSAWETVSEFQPENYQAQFLQEFEGPQYPWLWSAGVLIGLFGLSACTVNLPIKSLDRAK